MTMIMDAHKCAIRYVFRTHNLFRQKFIFELSFASLSQPSIWSRPGWTRIEHGAYRVYL